MKVGIIGTGGMANMHANQYRKIDGVEVTAACDIDPQRVKAYAEKHQIDKTFTDVDDFLANADCEGISIVTPDSTHAELSIKALQAGKHVLCEKPLATNEAEAEQMAAVAQNTGLINMVNFSYRSSSAWQRAKEMVTGGELGRIYHFQAHYLQSWLTTTDWGDWKTSPGWLWRLSTGHGSHGALGDIGVHILDFATAPIGRTRNLFCQLKAFDKVPGNKVGDYTLDANDSAMVTLECENGAMGIVAITRLATGHQNSLLLAIHGDKGALRIDLDKSYQMLDICRIGPEGKAQPWESIYCGHTPTNYERFVNSVRTGVQDQPDFVRGAEIQRMLDCCNRSARENRMIPLTS